MDLLALITEDIRYTESTCNVTSLKDLAMSGPKISEAPFYQLLRGNDVEGFNLIIS